MFIFLYLCAQLIRQDITEFNAIPLLLSNNITSSHNFENSQQIYSTLQKNIGSIFSNLVLN